MITLEREYVHRSNVQHIFFLNIRKQPDYFCPQCFTPPRSKIFFVRSITKQQRKRFYFNNCLPILKFSACLLNSAFTVAKHATQLDPLRNCDIFLKVQRNTSKCFRKNLQFVICKKNKKKQQNVNKTTTICKLMPAFSLPLRVCFHQFSNLRFKFYNVYRIFLKECQKFKNDASKNCERKGMRFCKHFLRLIINPQPVHTTFPRYN